LIINYLQNQETIKTYRLLYQTVQVCKAHGVENVMLCPGSRSAPLALSFMRFEGIKHYVIPDERSAAYTALGMARQSKKPVALVCTSGTAALNFAPAVAEAFFSEIPLIVFTADRPEEWIGQADNQAIYQEHIYGKNVKAEYCFPTDLQYPDSEWYAIRIANEALNIAMQHPRGPVHINVPLREPLYLENEPDFSDVVAKIIKFEQGDKSIPNSIFESLAQYKKVLVVAGTHRPNEKLKQALSDACKDKHIVFIPDITSNLIHTPGSISFGELAIDAISKDTTENFVPELVISFGGPIVSKTLKNFLKHKNIKAHWHLNGHPASADTFQRLTNILDVNAPTFFKTLAGENALSFDKAYFDAWATLDIKASQSAKSAIESLKFSEIRAAYEIINSLPANTVLHLGNSLPVRYASVFPFINPNIEVHSNRGTSGIDGTVSAAAGQSMVDDRNHILMVGDLGFIYDSNGLWNNYLGDNFKIIVLNNHGGGIFKTLPGARSQKELEEYFVVKQPLRFEHLALQHNCEYIFCNDLEGLKPTLGQLLATKGKPAILELEFDQLLSIEDVKEKLGQ
jgi:2-succinyl-5-enolpyruvyl-6-hydroxy-3-cyclohexene-1-carboxylate synthase